MSCAPSDASGATTLRAPAGAVLVEAPARLHLGFIDPSGSLGRRYGSLGLAIDAFPTRVRLALAEEDAYAVDPPHAVSFLEKIRGHVDALRTATGCRAPLHVRVEAAPPVHAGFGSGTQLALALGRAFAIAHGLGLTTVQLAALLARGARSGVGIAAFDEGGLILDAGPGAGGEIAPVLARLEFPPEWCIVLALDDRDAGLHGNAEIAALTALAPFAREDAAAIAHEVLMRLLPAVAERSFGPFAQALGAIQRRLGDYFSPVQHGSMFTSAAIAAFFGWVATHAQAGIGQSSWGPTGFAFVPSQAVAECVMAEARAANAVTEHVRLLAVHASNRGAIVTLDSPSRYSGA